MTDGLALVAYTATARLRGPAARYAWAVVILAAGLSGLAQAFYLTGAPTEVAPALRFGVGAWPAVAAAMAAHLLHLLTADSDADRAETEVPATAPDVQSKVQQPHVPCSVQSGVQADLAGVFRPTVQPDHASGSPEIGLNTPEAGSNRPDSSLNPVDDDPRVTVPRQSLRERAETVALRYVQRHSSWPTVSELEAAASVSRGTAAAALKAVRNQPVPLHLVPSAPEATNEANETAPGPETQLDNDQDAETTP